MGFELFADLDGFRNPAEFFNGPRPDILLKIGNELTAIELSCCYENNFTKAHEYKIKRYENLKDSLVNKEHVLSKLFVEISSLGFFPRRIKDFRNFCRQFAQINTTRMMHKMSEIAIRSRSTAEKLKQARKAVKRTVVKAKSEWIF